MNGKLHDCKKTALKVELYGFAICINTVKFNSLPKEKILEWSKFIDNKNNVTQKLKIVFGRIYTSVFKSKLSQGP